MNKCIILWALFALIGVVSANVEPRNQASAWYYDALDREVDDEFTELSIVPDDDEETAYLAGDKQIFQDFCKQSRDEVLSFLRESTNGAAARVYEIMFTSASDLGSEILLAHNEAVEEGAQLIREHAVRPAAASPDHLESAQEVRDNVAQSVENISLLGMVAQAVRVVINTVVETVQTEMFKRIALLRQEFTPERLKELVNEVCQSISIGLTNRLDRKLAEAKSQIGTALRKSKAPNAAEIMATMKTSNTGNIGCVTAGRIIKVGQFCGVLRLAGPILGF